ncbi:MAG: ABC transporter permease, partial [Actinotalea sp.]|nr:ABC transporter permease [Actinotalea sp.]
LGIVVAVLGAATALASTAAGRPTGAVVGVVAIVLGVVTTSGSLVTLAGRLAPRLGAVGRIAVRDAARHRPRTGPAVAAVVAAVAGLGAAGVYQESQAERLLREYRPSAAPGTVAVNFLAGRSSDDVAALLGPTQDALRGAVPADQVHPVALVVPAERPGAATGWTSVTAERPAAQRCPLWTEEGTFTDAEVKALRGDPRCASSAGSGTILWSDPTGATSDVLVDDGRVVRALGYAESPAAARALAEGRVVVKDRFAIRPDGTVRLEVATHPFDGGGERRGAPVDLPGAHVALPGMQYEVVLPPTALADLDLEAVTVGLVATTTRTPTAAEVAAAAAAVGDAGTVFVEPLEPFGGANLTQLVLAAAAAVVALGATGIAVGLAAVESRPDLATLAAVGAEPRTRRRFSATQAGLVAGLGTVVGTVAGVALGVVLVLARLPGYESPPVVVLPWATLGLQVLGIPLLAVAVGWVAVRANLPLTRRAAL